MLWLFVKFKPILCAKEVLDENNWFGHAFHHGLTFYLGTRVRGRREFTHVPIFEKMEECSTVAEKFGFSVY